MLNKRSLEVLERAMWNIPFKRPLYKEYAFSQIPQIVRHLFDPSLPSGCAKDALAKNHAPYDIVLTLLIDGFGWNLLEKYGPQISSLRRFEEEGVLSKFSSQFPTTTAAHITTLHSGLEVGQTGIYEWFYYEPLLDQMIAPLLFSFARDHEPETLLKTSMAPEKIFPFPTLYEQLHRQGVSSYVLQPQNIAHSPYSQVMCAGAELHGYKDLKEGFQYVVDSCKEMQSSPRYIYIYFGEVDAIGHRQGIGSDAILHSVQACWAKVERELYLPLKNISKRIALLITADHGMSPVDPKTTIYLNKRFPKLQSTLKKNQQGGTLVPAGSCRDFFLHVQPKHLSDVYSMLKEEMQSIAQVHMTQDLLNMHFFGEKGHSPRLLERIGDIVVLPLYSESVWWYEHGVFEQHFYGAHGGLTKEEIEIPFFFCDIHK